MWLWNLETINGRKDVCLSDIGLIHLLWLSPVASNPLKTCLTLRQHFGRLQWVEMRMVELDNWRVSCCSRLCQNKPTVTRERACLIDCRLGPKAIKTSAFLWIHLSLGNPIFYPCRLCSLHLWRASGHEFIWRVTQNITGGSMLITVSVNHSCIFIQFWNTLQK